MKRTAFRVGFVSSLLICLVVVFMGGGISVAAQDELPSSLGTVEDGTQTNQAFVEQEAIKFDGSYLSGPLQYVDPRYSYSLDIPASWIIYPSDPAAIIASAHLCNYDPQVIEDQQLERPPSAICIQLGVGLIEENESFTEWVIRKRASELDPNYSGQGVRQASKITSAKIGIKVSASFLLSNTDGSEVLEIDVPGETSVVVAAISPADSPAIADAINILNTLALLPQDAGFNIPSMAYSVGATHPAEIEELDALLNGSGVYKLPKELDRLLNNGREEILTLSPLSPASCSGAGSFDRGEAPTSPITLWVPFKSGETWVVGGSGSFYGNYAHGNCNNDYYATDWNRSDDYGADVMPAAPGTISNATSPCASTGLGCSIGVTHDSGIKTSYGHLSQIYKYSGEAKLGERIGAVGNTGCGNCGYHLHLGFHKLDSGYYRSRCNSGIVNGKCPNGENPLSPQTPRPSPISTQNGTQTLVDGNSYTSNNSSGGGGGSNCSNVTFNGIILYDDKNCNGSSRQFGGATNWIDVSDFNDKASSVHVKTGWSVRVYEHSKNDQNGGKNRCLFGSMWDLSLDYYPGSSTKIDNTISSIQVFTNGNCTASGPPTASHSLQMYKDANWQSGYCFMDTADYYINIDGCPGFNDQISSLVLKSGWSARVFEHQKMGGGNKCFTGNESDMAGDHYDNGANLNDSISSVILYNSSNCAPWPPEPSHSIQLYKDANWLSGSCYADNAGSYPNIDSCSGYNEEVTSLLLKPGWSVRVFEHQNYSGGHKCFTGNDADLANDQFDNGKGVNDSLSSFVLYNATNCPAWVTTPPAPTLKEPSNGTTFVEGESITLSWNSASGATEYYGEFSSLLGTNPFGWQSATSKSIGSQWPGYEYSWRIKARNNVGESGYSGSWKFKIIPATPSNVSAQATSCHNVSLTWDDNSSSEDGFNIYRNGTAIKSVNSNTTSSSDEGLQSGTSYTYVIRSYRNGYLSNESNTASITPPPCPPIAEFDAWPLSGQEPLTVSFHDISQGSYTSCVWDYGDGTNSSTCGGSGSYHDHTYMTAGTYSPKLTVIGPGGSDSQEIPNYISVQSSCEPGPDGITFYSEPNFAGSCITLKTDDPYLGSSNFNDLISSVQFRGSYAGSNWEVSLFKNLNYDGDFTNLRGNDANLVDNQVGDNQVSSIRIWQDFDDDRPMYFGQPRLGTIDPYTDRDQYSFYGAQGQVISINMTAQVGNTLDSHLTLYNSKWNLLAQDDNSGGGKNARIQYTLPSNGRYWLTTKNINGPGTGDYSLSLTIIANPLCQPGSNGIILYEHSNYSGWCITLTGSDPSLINNYFHNMASSIRFVGSYRNAGWQVSLFDWQNYSGSFANFLGDDSDLSNNGIGNDRTTSVRIWRDYDDGRSLTYGQPLNGRIHVPSDGDTYKFYGLAGHVVTISMVRVGENSLNSFLTLYNPKWAKIAFDNDSGGSGNALVQHFILPVSGTYQVQARSFGYASLGDYQITLTSP